MLQETYKTIGKAIEEKSGVTDAQLIDCGEHADLASTIAFTLAKQKKQSIAFQLADDALDYSAKQATLGKSVGDDFREGKITLPVILAYRRSDAEERNFWRRTLEQVDRQEDGDLERAIGLMTKYDALADTLRRARHYGALPELVTRTDLLAIVPQMYADSLGSRYAVRVWELPGRAPRYDVRMVWHQSSTHDAAHTWLRECVRRLFSRRP